MDWKIVAIEKLQQYEAKKQALELIPQQIADVESRMTNIRSGSYISPVSGGKSTGKEDALLDCIVLKENLELFLEETQRWLDIVDSGLSVLNWQHKLCLERLYIHKEKNAAERLCDELGVRDVRTVYKMRDQAVRLFTISQYGFTER